MFKVSLKGLFIIKYSKEGELLVLTAKEVQSILEGKAWPMVQVRKQGHGNAIT